MSNDYVDLTTAEKSRLFTAGHAALCEAGYPVPQGDDGNPALADVPPTIAYRAYVIGWLAIGQPPPQTFEEFTAKRWPGLVTA